MLSLVEETHLTSVFLSEDRDQKGCERSSSKDAKVQKNFFGNKEKTGGAWVCNPTAEEQRPHHQGHTQGTSHHLLAICFLAFYFSCFHWKGTV